MRIKCKKVLNKNLAYAILTVSGFLFMKTSRISTVFSRVNSFVWIYIFNFYLTSVYAYNLIKCPNLDCYKLVLSGITRPLVLVAILFSFKKKSHQLQNVLKAFHRLEMEKRLKKNNLFFNALSSIFFVTHVTFLIFTLRMFAKNDFATANWFGFFFAFNDKNTAIFTKKIAVVFVLALYRMFVVIYPSILMIYLSSVFYALSKVIANLEKVASSQLYAANNMPDLILFTREYKNIHKVAKSLDGVCSVPLFWLACYIGFDLFSIFNTLFGNIGQHYSIIDFEQSNTRFSHCFLFLLMVYYAADAERKDTKLRKLLKEGVYHLSLFKKTDVLADLLEQLVDSKAKIVFKAWGVVELKRGFILTYLGTVLSYNLLIVYLDSNELKQ